jgi:hypothetical protein
MQSRAVSAGRSRLSAVFFAALLAIAVPLVVPAASPAIEMHTYGKPFCEGQKLVGKGGFGYGFFDETYRERALHLDWDVTTTMSLVGRRGVVKCTVASEQQHLGVVRHIENHSFWLDTLSRPALYRYDIEFRDHGMGELLGAYSEYLRVVKPVFRARLGIDRTVFLPGQPADLAPAATALPSPWAFITHEAGDETSPRSSTSLADLRRRLLCRRA